MKVMHMHPARKNLTLPDLLFLDPIHAKLSNS